MGYVVLFQWLALELEWQLKFWKKSPKQLSLIAMGTPLTLLTCSDTVSRANWCGMPSILFKKSQIIKKLACHDANLPATQTGAFVWFFPSNSNALHNAVDCMCRWLKVHFLQLWDISNTVKWAFGVWQRSWNEKQDNWDINLHQARPFGIFGVSFCFNTVTIFLAEPFNQHTCQQHKDRRLLEWP